jgi:hypothetical protein
VQGGRAGRLSPSCTGALVACLHRRGGMREPILPPPLPLRVAVWAMLNVVWFRVVGALQRAGSALREEGLRSLAGRPTPEPARRALAPCLVTRGPGGGAGDERATVVEGQRAR